MLDSVGEESGLLDEDGRALRDNNGKLVRTGALGPQTPPGVAMPSLAKVIGQSPQSVLTNAANFAP